VIAKVAENSHAELVLELCGVQRLGAKMCMQSCAELGSWIGGFRTIACLRQTDPRTRKSGQELQKNPAAEGSLIGSREVRPSAQKHVANVGQ